MEIPRIDYRKKYKLIASVWDRAVIGTGTLSRILAKSIVPAPQTKVISKTLYGFDLLIDPVIDRGVEQSLYYFGTYEKGTLHFIEEHLKKGDVFYDVGANIGLMAIFAANQVGSAGKVIAFEANPETLGILNYNIGLNYAKQIQSVGKAIGSENGFVEIYNNWAVNRGGATIVKPNDSALSSQVEMISIDGSPEFGNGRIDMVKIDVEGFEMNVLKGMTQVLKRDKPPILIVECSADRKNDYTSINDLYRFIKSVNDYKVYKLSNGKERYGQLVEVKNEAELPRHDNIFCLKND